MTSSVWDTSSNGGCRIDGINTGQFVLFFYPCLSWPGFKSSDDSFSDVIDCPVSGLQSVDITFPDWAIFLGTSAQKGTQKVPGTKYYHLMENPKKRVQSSWAGTSGKQDYEKQCGGSYLNIKVQRSSHQLVHPPIWAATHVLNKPGIWTKDKYQLLSQRKLSTNEFTI